MICLVYIICHYTLSYIHTLTLSLSHMHVNMLIHIHTHTYTRIRAHSSITTYKHVLSIHFNHPAHNDIIENNSIYTYSIMPHTLMFLLVMDISYTHTHTYTPCDLYPVTYIYRCVYITSEPIDNYIINCSS